MRAEGGEAETRIGKDGLKDFRGIYHERDLPRGID